MDYLRRLAETKFLRLSKNFPVVLVCGPRQVGKTTMLQELAKKENRTFVTLDDLSVRAMANDDPALFFQTYKTPIIIDEIQKAPPLFSQIKLLVDRNKQAGEIWLTGSQSYSLMKNVSESLAGRVGLLNMYSFTLQEIRQLSYKPLTRFDFQSLNDLNSQIPPISAAEIFQHIFYGGMPNVIGKDAASRKDYFFAYVNTYLLKDAMDFGGISDSVRFYKFLEGCAAQVSQQLNLSTLAGVAGISEPTAKTWLETLQGMGIIYLLHPYYNNNLKRLIKTPKLYFYDTGLCAYLLKWPNPETLQSGPLAGALFENFAVNQLQIKYQLADDAPEIFYYRDIDAKEVDIVLSDFNSLTPLEIKTSATPKKVDIAKFEILSQFKKKINDGGIVCNIPAPLKATENNSFIPINLL